MNRLFASTVAVAIFMIIGSVNFGTEITGAMRTIKGDLTLSRAVEIALRQNPEILKQIQEIERTRGQVIEVRAEALPHVVADSAFSQQDRRLLESSGASVPQPLIVVIPTGDTTPQLDLSPLEKKLGSGSSGGSSGPNDKSWRVSIEARQVLYAGGQVKAAINIAKFTEDVSYYQLRDIIDQVISTTRVQFYDVLLNRALIKVQEESVQLLGDQLKDQQNRFEAGTVPRFNVLRAEVALANQQPDLIRARNNYIIAQLRLAKTLNLDPGPQGQTTFNCVGEFGVPERSIGLESAIQLALQRRAYLKIQRQQILIAKEQIKVALAGYKPTLNANAGYELRNRRLSDQLDDTVDGWFYGITGSWNIFDGLATYGQVKQARALLESSKINYEDAVHQVELEVQQTYANLRAAREVIRSQQKNVEQAQEALRLANERFAAGAGTQLDVLDARTSLTQAQTTEVQSRAAYNAELAVFDRVTATDTVYAEMFKDPLVEGKRPKAQAVKASAAKPTPKAAPKPTPPRKATTGAQ
jgi:outer membrane protein TolC